MLILALQMSHLYTTKRVPSASEQFLWSQLEQKLQCTPSSLTDSPQWGLSTAGSTWALHWSRFTGAVSFGLPWFAETVFAQIFFPLSLLVTLVIFASPFFNLIFKGLKVNTSLPHCDVFLLLTLVQICEEEQKFWDLCSSGILRSLKL